MISRLNPSQSILRITLPSHLPKNGGKFLREPLSNVILEAIRITYTATVKTFKYDSPLSLHPNLGMYYSLPTPPPHRPISLPPDNVHFWICVQIFPIPTPHTHWPRAALGAVGPRRMLGYIEAPEQPRMGTQASRIPMQMLTGSWGGCIV